MSTVPGIFAAYAWKSVGFTLWYAPATLESLQVYEQACRDCLERAPGNWSSVHIMVPGNSSLPSAEVRAALAQLMREYSGSTAAAAVLIPGTGFWASALRGVVTAVHMLGSRDYDVKIFGSIEELAAWLPAAHQKRGGAEFSSSELLTALRQLRRTADSAAA